MYYNPFSRRYFLRGLGISLALPFLPSIMRKAYAASAPPPRFIQIMNAHGQFPDQYFTTDTALTAQSPSGIFAKPLNSIAGDFSQVIGPAFNPLKNKFSVVRGLSVITSPGANGDFRHNTTQGSCCSGTSSDNNEDSPPYFPYSSDSVMSESAKIYPSAVGIQRHVNFSPGTDRYPNFSWNKIGGVIQHMPFTRSTAALLSKFAPLNTSGTSTTTITSTNQRNYNILQAVFPDYVAVRDSGKLSSADKLTFEAYMSHIDLVQRGLTSTAPSCTSKPLAESEVDVDAAMRNQINILIAAMACQLTRVGAISMSISYDTYHAMAHIDDIAHKPTFGVKQASLGNLVAYLMAKMDAIPETAGTLLDNSLIYWGNEYGENLTTVNTGDQAHSAVNMPVLVAGGAAGALRMGYYIDYRKTGGRPLNNLLISFFNAMGLSSADYERGGVVGFGEYDANAASKLGFTAYLAATERRKPLPFLFNGTPLG
jgi:hypothetical protein